MKIHNKMRFMSLLVTLLLVFTMTAPAMVGAAQPTVNLGTTSGFAVLAYSTITNTGTTTINGNYGGDVGLYPGTDFPGQASVSVSGAVHLTDAVASKAQDDLVTAYNDADGRGPVTRINSELGGTTLIPGVYDSANGTFQITGTLTLDAQGDPDGVFIFKTGTTLITAADSSINLINSARFCRTFWKVGSSATLGADSHFVGHIFALTSITANSGATVQGQLLARTGAVTLHSNTITNGLCATTPAPAVLHVIKHVINDSGRTADAANFNLHVKMSGSDVAASPAPGVESPGTTYTLAAGTYAISEDAYAGYTLSYSGDSDSNGNITLASGDNKTVTITNNDTSLAVVNPAPAILHVIKHVINDSGRTADAANFNVHVKMSGSDVAASPAPGVESPGTTYTLAAGTYVVSEEYYSGYTVSYSGDSDSSGNITLAPGESKTVTITNNDTSRYSGGGGGTVVVNQTPAILHVIKHVINDSGGTAIAGNFNLHVKIAGNEVGSSPSPGVESPGTSYMLAAGTYVVSENTYNGYTTSYSGDSDSDGNITLASGDNKTVTVTNNDIPLVVVKPAPAILHVIKHVINDSGRTAVAANFKLHVKTLGYDIAASPSPGVESPGKTYTLPAGTYAISEDAYAGYTLSYSGNGDSSGNITLASGDNKTVTITNNDIPSEYVTTTVTGGQLPNTATPLYEWLLIGAAFILVVALSWTRRKRNE